MMFSIQNTCDDCGRASHCGVLEFTAEEGFVFLPQWMMDNLKILEGDLILLKNVSLPKGTYVKLQPHTTDFVNISDPKAVLEKKPEEVCLFDHRRYHYNLTQPEEV